MKRLLVGILELWKNLRDLESRTALRPVFIPIRKQHPGQGDARSPARRSAPAGAPRPR